MTTTREHVFIQRRHLFACFSSQSKTTSLGWGGEGGANMNISTKLAAGIRPSTMSSSRRLRRLFYGINSTRASHSHMPRYCYFNGDTWVVGCRSKEGGLVTMCTLHCYVLRKNVVRNLGLLNGGNFFRTLLGEVCAECIFSCCNNIFHRSSTVNVCQWH